MEDQFYAVIMAGGSGSRLWPLSRKNNPKQSLVLDGDKTLFQQAIARLRGLFPWNEFWLLLLLIRLRTW